MSNFIVKAFLFLALLFIFGAAAIIVIIFLTNPILPPRIGIPKSGGDIRLGPSATAAPTLRFIPPVPNDIHAQSQIHHQAIPEPQADVRVFTAIPPTPTPPPIQITPSGTQAPLSPNRWRDWPALPVVSDHARQIYQEGVANGSDPHAFSILGDCQSQPDIFLGVYDSDPTVMAQLSPPLQETVANFKGSFSRYSPTVKDATTAGAELWAAWNDNQDGLCKADETPLACELRVRRPSIVLISLGTHWEARNQHYLSIILDTVLANHALPVLATKADDRELDWRLNQDMAELATKYDIPLWNFWADVQDLPDHGLYPVRTSMPLIDEALARRQISGLQALDTVWRAVRPPTAN